ncbi:hypothetical protein E3N88_21779 [Mikania micrantha]|uniref:Uncharacterized protein n=1 Tax=Mikania micrantha TaxID=192012 RepID=A0A5N6NB38_9ASTR|nr:hypothetical protein E3N88_21779 [Mikania micrantha]
MRKQKHDVITTRRKVPLDIYVSMRNRKPKEQLLLLSELCYFAFMRTREKESQKRRHNEFTFIVATLTFILAGGSKKPIEEILFELLCDLWDADAKNDATYVENGGCLGYGVALGVTRLGDCTRRVPLDIYVSMRNRKPNEQHLLLSELCYFAFMRAQENESQKRRHLY